MARFYGVIGFSRYEETAPGVHTEVVTERSYFGDVIRDVRRSDSTPESLNDNLNISNRFSIVADSQAFDDLEYMRYIKWANVFWKISSIEIQRPRLILSVGGVYNGPLPDYGIVIGSSMIGMGEVN